MKKNLRSILTLLLITVMALTAIVPVMAYASESALLQNEDDNGNKLLDSIDTGWLTIEKYEGNSIVVTLTPDVDALMDLNKAEIKEILAEVIAMAKDIAVNDLKGDIIQSMKDSVTNVDGTAVDFNDLEDLLTVAFNSYLEKLAETENDEKYLSYDYVDFFVDVLADEDNSLIDGFAGHVCNLIKLAYKANLVTLEELNSYGTLVNGKVNIEDKIVDALHNKVNALVSEKKNDYITDCVNTYLAYTFNGGSAPEASILAAADKALAAQVRAAAENVLAGNVTTKLETLLSDKLSEEQIYGISVLPDDQIVAEFKNIVDSAENADEIEAEITANIETAVKEKVDSMDYSEYESQVYELVLGITKNEFDSKLAGYAVRVNSKYADLLDDIDNVENDSFELTATSLINYIDFVSIGGEKIYNKGGADKIDIQACKALLRSIPMPYDIAQMADEDMKLTYDVVVGTDVEGIKGSCEMTLTAKVGGGYDEIRTICRIISDYVDVRLTGNNSVDIDVTVPARFSKILLRAAESGQFSDALKHKIFSAFMADGSEIYSLYQDLTFEDLMNLISAINFEGLLDKEFIKQYVDLSHLTNEQIEAKVRQYEKYFNLAKKYVDKVARVAYNKVSNDYPQYLDNTFLSVFDHKNDPNDVFTYSNGEFGYVGTHSIRYGFILENAEEYLSKIYDKTGSIGPVEGDFGEWFAFLVDTFAPNIDYNDYFTFSVDLSVKVEDVNMVEYYDLDGKFIREGLLPVGADVNFFSNYKPGSEFIWMDEDGNEIVEMPDRDVKLYAVRKGEVEIDPDEKLEFVYDGNEREIAVNIIGVSEAELAKYTYEWNNGATGSVITVKDVADSGTYTCIVRYNGAIVATKQIEVVINPAKVEKPAADTTVFVYTGAEQTYTVASSNKYTVTGDKRIDAGSQTVTVSLADKANYVWADETSEDVTFTFDIAKANAVITVDTTDIVVTFGTAVVLPEASASFGTVVCDKTAADLANAGEYTVTYSVEGTENYNGATATITVTINKLTITADDFVFAGADEFYNGQDHSITVTAGNNDYLAYVDITYYVDGKAVDGAYAQSKVGTAEVTAKITIKSEYADNCVFADDAEELELKATLTVKTGIFTNGAVTVEGLIPFGTQMTQNDVTNSFKSFDTITVAGNTVKIIVAYDIKFEGITSWDGKETYRVTITLPNGISLDNLGVAYIEVTVDENGNYTTITKTVSQNNVKIAEDGKSISFDANHFSIYAVIEDAAITPVDNGQEEDDLLWLWILLATFGIAGIAVLVYFILKGQEENNKPIPAATIAAEKKAAEAPKADKPIETVEAKPETYAAPAAPVVEEPITEEVVADEPAVEEVAAEETVTEEIAAEEAVVEELVEAEEAPVVEEAPVAEPEIEEITAEPEVAEAPAEPEIVEVQKSAVIVMSESGKDATAVIGDETVLIRFRRSYMSRLIQATENVQSYYSAIKNQLLSYKGVKARESWNYEAFNKGRIQCAKLNIKGKTLVLNLNLNPADFNINKYHFIDCSDKPKYAKVPMMMKVRSARSLKYALELIDEMMKVLNVPKLDVAEVDYRMPYETTEALAKRGLVKIILPAGVTLSDDMTFVQMNVSELIESGTVVKATEQTMTEAPEIVEAPAAEEAPVVEKAPAVEEAPTVEEAPAPVATIEIHVDAITADELISDEEAEAKIEVIHTGANARSGKTGEINLDVICENFNDGDVVDVEALRNKRLISSKVVKVKVLARGVMTKKLTIIASKFSLQAVKMIHLAGGKAEIED